MKVHVLAELIVKPIVPRGLLKIVVGQAFTQNKNTLIYLAISTMLKQFYNNAKCDSHMNYFVLVCNIEAYT